MVELKFTNGGLALEPELLSLSSMIRKVKERICSAVRDLSCPVHRVDYSGTIVIDSDNSDFSWCIASPCCETFTKMLEYAIPYPLDRARRSDSAYRKNNTD